jgi:hypothetical protein
VATKKKTNEGVPFDECPKCRGPIVHESMMNEKQDACYHKVKSRYKVWPSAYASGALVQCRKKGASNWGNSKKNENNVLKGIVDESKNFVPNNILTEGKVLLEGRVVRKLWESAGQKIIEAQLTPQQIQQIFQAAEQGQTTAGGNRTFAGKGVDAASAVNRAWEDLKTKIQNTGPIQNMDAMYDKAAEAMKKSTGGDQGAMQYVQKYRDFAKKHPIAQSFLYAALIAAAGLSGAGLGGAAALGLLKMTDKLLQGQKFSSAAYSGAKTGGLAYAAGQIGQQMKGADAAQPAQPVQVDPTDGFDADALYRDLSGADVTDPTDGFDADALYRDLSGADVTDPTDGFDADAPASAATDAPAAPASAVNQAPDVNQAADTAVSTATDNITQNDILNSVDKEIRGKVVDMDFETSSWAKLANGRIVDPDFPMDIDANNSAMRAYKLMNKTNEGIQLSKYQVFNILEAAIVYQTVINEGLLDKFKGAASKVGQYAATKGKNITTKITADKLMQAWKKAGSPTDSEQVKAVLKAAGVADQIIASVMPVQASIAGVSPKATTGTIQSTMKATTQPTVAAKPQAPAAPAQAAQPTSAIGQGIAQSPQSNVNPELYNRLAARKAGKPIYSGGLEEAKAKQYVKPYNDPQTGEQIGWVSSDGYHKKYWQKFAKASAIKHAKLNPDEVQEDYTGEFAAEKTPAINPYGGLKDNKFRGAISEEPTNNPTGASGEGGTRRYRPKPAGTFNKEELDEGVMQKIGAAAMAAALALGSTAVKAEPVYVYKAPTGDFKAVLSPADIPANAMRRLVVDTENDDVAILGKDGSETSIKLDPSTVNSIKQQAGVSQAKSTQPQAAAQQSAAPKTYREKFGTGAVFKGKNVEKYGLTNTFNDPFSQGQDEETLLKNIKKIHDGRPPSLGEKVGSLEFIDSDNNKADKIARVNYTNGRLDIYLMRGGMLKSFVTPLNNIPTGKKIKYIMLWADWTVGTPQEKKPMDFKEDTSYAGGMGQGGNAGESYRKFKPKSAGTFKEDELDEACWKGYHKEGNKKMFGKTYPNCVKNTNEEQLGELSPELLGRAADKASKISKDLDDKSWAETPFKSGIVYSFEYRGIHGLERFTISAPWDVTANIGAYGERKLFADTEITAKYPNGVTKTGTIKDFPDLVTAMKHYEGGRAYNDKSTKFSTGAANAASRAQAKSSVSDMGMSPAMKRKLGIEEKQLDEKCWDTHKQVGMKNKGGRQVPNCVPKESAIMKGLKSL